MKICLLLIMFGLSRIVNAKCDSCLVNNSAFIQYAGSGGFGYSIGFERSFLHLRKSYVSTSFGYTHSYFGSEKIPPDFKFKPIFC